MSDDLMAVLSTVVLSEEIMAGLEQFSAIKNVQEYTCGYSCKGSQNSGEWNKVFKTVVEKVADRVCVMTGGEIVEQNVTSEIFTAARHPYTPRS